MFSRSVRSFSSSSAAAIKVSARDSASSLSTISVVVNNAGSKSGKTGVAHLLSKYNFLNTEAKLALRFTRESELLGGVFSSQVTRDAIVLNTTFLKQDLPYYVEALGNVLTKTSFRPHELPENVLPVAIAEANVAAANPVFVAEEALHELSFRKGYGQPLYYSGASISVDDIKQFADQAYTASNVSVFASGVNEQDLAGFVAESPLSALKEGSSAAATSVATFVGKESRIRKSGVATVAAIAVPVKTADFAKFEIISTAIGSSTLPAAVTPLSKLPGSATSKLIKYQNAGLFVISVADADASVVAGSIKAAKAIVDSLTAKELSGAVKSAQLSAALQSSFEGATFEVTEASAKADLKLKASEFNYVVVGDVDALPYADEL